MPDELKSLKFRMAEAFGAESHHRNRSENCEAGSACASARRHRCFRRAADCTRWGGAQTGNPAGNRSAGSFQVLAIGRKRGTTNIPCCRKSHRGHTIGCPFNGDAGRQGEYSLPPRAGRNVLNRILSCLPAEEAEALLSRCEVVSLARRQELI